MLVTKKWKKDIIYAQNKLFYMDNRLAQENAINNCYFDNRMSMNHTVWLIWISVRYEVMIMTSLKSPQQILLQKSIVLRSFFILRFPVAWESFFQILNEHGSLIPSKSKLIIIFIINNDEKSIKLIIQYRKNKKSQKSDIGHTRHGRWCYTFHSWTTNIWTSPKTIRTLMAWK